MHDFHTHTFLGDGVLSPIEMIRNAAHIGYKTIAITEHCSGASLRRMIEEVGKDCRVAEENWEICAVVGVELTHLPLKEIDKAAKSAKEYGAKIVLVHGETIVEPVLKGTNLAALESEFVDVLAHPGILSDEEAKLAAETGKFLEITSRRGHSLTNGRVAAASSSAGSSLLINSDAHGPYDLNTNEFIEKVGLGAGLDKDQIEQIIEFNTKKLLLKINNIK